MAIGIESISGAHEPDQLRGGSILLTIVALAATLAAIYLAVWLALPGALPALPRANPLPDAPAVRDWGDAGVEQLRRLREREDANLHSWQWLDDRHSARRIPIERAMELLAQPARPATGGAP